MKGPYGREGPPIAVRAPPPPIAIRAPSLWPLWEGALWAMLLCRPLLLWAMAAAGYGCCRLYLPCRLCLLYAMALVGKSTAGAEDACGALVSSS